MRILMVEYSGKSGMYSYTDALCNALCGIGADVTILTSAAWPDRQRPYKVERLFLEFTQQQTGLNRLHWAADRLSRSMINILRRNKYATGKYFDVVHIQGIGVPMLDQFLLKGLAKILPVVVTIHDVVSHYERIASRDSFMRNTLQIPHRLIVHYENGKKQLVERWKIESNKIDVIPHGIIPVQNQIQMKNAREKLNLPASRKILLFFGSIRPNKGLDVLLKSMKEVISQNPDALLVIAGALPRGMSFEPYSDIIEKLKLSENVKSFIKFIPDEDVDYYFAACDMVVLPYLRFESQSGVLLRAYAHKIPVVVSNVGAMGEIINNDKTGIAVEPNNEKALACAINSILNNPDKYKPNYSDDLETKYGWESISKLTLQSCEKTIAQFNQKTISV
jgi:D-inositol-3-phosphate glycosyltransferase